MDLRRTTYILMAVAALMGVSCQKEEPVTTLNLNFEHYDDSKLHLVGAYPYWDNDDTVAINGAACLVAVDGSGNASTQAATASEYRMVFPASLVAQGNPMTNNQVPVVLPLVQQYRTNGNGTQLISAPMCAKALADDGNNPEGNAQNIIFHNLGALVQVDVTNHLSDGKVMEVTSITLISQNCNLSGSGSIADLSATAPVLNMAAAVPGDNKQKSVTLNFGTPASVLNGNTEHFILSVPPCPISGKFAVELFARVDGSEKKFVIVSNDPTTIARNAYLAISFDVSSSNMEEVAEDPYNVNHAMSELTGSTAQEGNNTIEQVEFQFGSSITTKNVIYINDMTKASVKCYLSWDDVSKKMTIHVPVNELPQVDLSGMFAHMTALTEVNFGGGFQHSHVLSTAGMFAGCTSLSSVDLSGLNLNSCSNMAYMFRGCSSLTSISWPAVGHFGPSPSPLGNVTTVSDMRLMFAQCSSLASISLPDFHTTSSTNMQMMFGMCDALRSITLHEHFVVGEGSFRNDMFTNVHHCVLHCTESQWSALSSSNTHMGSNCSRSNE